MILCPTSMPKSKNTAKFRYKVCLLFAEGFVGLGISDSKNESLHNKLKAWIPQQLNYTQALKRTLSFIEDQNTIAATEVDI